MKTAELHFIFCYYIYTGSGPVVTLCTIFVCRVYLVSRIASDGVPWCPHHGDIYCTAAHLLIGLHSSGLGCRDAAWIESPVFVQSTICCIYTHLKTLLTGCGGLQSLDRSIGFISWQVSRPAAELGSLLGSGNATNRSVQDPVQK